ncbi:sensor histidine kinase [Streptomyces sp. XD-27]|uniref:sensor histidine kinase n=1 Tax=Streptomyces sp. XD-27 TaxID=3062779 RepID=UPI0026F47A4C|nr:histidine kinase [Streptomyces sp. XD-27]WKX70131.1 histidine kinase [Streptomyces sp. XD-27]
MRGWIRHGLRLAAGLLVGTCTAVVELLYVAVAGLALLSVTAWPGTRQRVLRPVTAGVRWLCEVERRRLDRLLGHRLSARYGGRRALRYLAVRWALGLLGGLVLFSLAVGALYLSFLFWGWFIMSRDTALIVLSSGTGGLLLTFLGVQGVIGVAALEGQLARHFLDPSQQEELRRRIDELASSRAGVVDAVHDERRRIERDLHDGVQQRLVVLGMLLGRARRSQDTEKITALVAQAHAESRQALTDLREVAWRVYPTVLDEAGLRAALETVAERSPIPVRLDYAFPVEPAAAVRTMAYFVVSEAVTNAIKHSAADGIGVEVAGYHPDGLRVRITDDGTGGADPAGSGLLGLRRRVAALDGHLRVDSPPGGPTTITAELPCA